MLLDTFLPISSMHSSYVTLGLPLGLPPSGLASKNCLSFLSSFIRDKCPNHLSCLWANLFSIGGCCRSSIIFWFLIKSLLVLPDLRRRHLISDAVILLMSLPLAGQLSLAYNWMGSKTVLWTFNFVCWFISFFSKYCLINLVICPVAFCELCDKKSSLQVCWELRYSEPFPLSFPVFQEKRTGLESKMTQAKMRLFQSVMNGSAIYIASELP